MGKNYSTKTYEPRQCKLCGRTFTPKHWNTIFCDPVCQRNYQQKKYYDTHYSRKMYTLVCKTCGKEFVTSYSNSLYCSEECRAYKPKTKKEPKQNRRFVYTKNLCPNPDCNWRLECGGGKAVCLRAKCNNGVVFT